MASAVARITRSSSQIACLRAELRCDNASSYLMRVKGCDLIAETFEVNGVRAHVRTTTTAQVSGHAPSSTVHNTPVAGELRQSTVTSRHTQRPCECQVSAYRSAGAVPRCLSMSSVDSVRIWMLRAIEFEIANR